MTLPPDLQGYPFFPSLDAALAADEGQGKKAPDVVSVNSHSDTHAQFAIAAMEAGCHVFVEKPLAPTVAEARRVADAARRTGRKLLVGYILRHHPAWERFVAEARALGSPCAMRMNLNQRSAGAAWEVHRKIMASVSPVVDCGVHYVDAMLRIARGRPVQVRGMGVRLSEEVPAGQVNYGHLQVTFEDGSVGWYEAGWGPMISETAYSVKDVMGPGGSASLVMDRGNGSADVNSHTKVSGIRVRRVGDGEAETMLDTGADVDHHELCAREQEYLADAIRTGRDLGQHVEDAVLSLAVVLAADQSMREKHAVDLDL